MFMMMTTNSVLIRKWKVLSDRKISRDLFQDDVQYAEKLIV